MKYLRGLAVVLVIFVLPAGSWYYLQSGYNYRLNALQELEPKGTFDKLSLEKDNIELFDDKISLICFCADVANEDLATLVRIEEKYDSRGFQLIKLEEKNAEYEKLLNKYGPKNLLLVDKDREYRRSYSFEEGEIKDLVQHASIVIPLPSRKKIKLKREG